MNYRLLRITNLYNEYISNYYDKFSEVIQMSYDEQYNHISDDALELVVSYARWFRKLGVDAINIFTNADHLQETWAREHGVIKNLSFIDLIAEQIKFYKPDVIWIDDSRLMNKSWIENLRKDTKTKLIVGHMCAPYNSIIENSLPSFDIMFTCSPCPQKEFIEMGVTSHCIYHSFDHDIIDLLKPENNTMPESDFIFTGSLYTGFGMHKMRTEYIEKMLESGINIKLYGNLEPRNKVLQKQSMYYTINLLKKLNLDFLIHKFPILKKHEQYGDEKITYYSKKLINSVTSPVFGLDMFKVLSKSKICFNIHGGIAKKCAGNIRLFEATGAGTCLVTDWKENLSDLFVLDKEVVTYKSIDECIDKVQWLIKNPSEAKKIAKAGQERTLKDHTVEKRVANIDQILRSKL